MDAHLGAFLDTWQADAWDAVRPTNAGQEARDAYYGDLGLPAGAIVGSEPEVDPEDHKPFLPEDDEEC